MNVVASQGGKAKMGIVSILFFLMSYGLNSQSLASGVPSDWVRISVAGRFDIMAPAGTVFQLGKGTDSIVGRILAPAFTLSVDYGAYSDPLDHMRGHERYVTREVRVDGKAAKIVTALAPRLSATRPYFIGIHFPNIKKTGRGSLKLTIFSLLDGSDGYQAVGKIYRTIEFK